MSKNPVITAFGKVDGINLPLFYPEDEIVSDLSQMHQRLLGEKSLFASFSSLQVPDYPGRRGSRVRPRVHRQVWLQSSGSVVTITR